ncbi:MAG: hypothetical protein ACREE3_07750, partial [Stellaceae bacterium]
EAICTLEWPKDELRILSLGCTSVHLNISWQHKVSLGQGYWAVRLADLYMKAQSSSALAMTHDLIGPAGLFRISPDVTGRGFTIDGAEHIPELEALGRAEASKSLPALQDIFFTEPAEPFVPYYRNEDSEPIPAVDETPAFNSPALRAGAVRSG